MKKNLALGLAGIMIVSMLTGCGSSNQNKSKFLLKDVNYNKYVKLCKYTGIDAEQIEFEVGEDEIQDSIEEQLYDYAEYPEINRAIEQGDMVSIAFTGTIDGQEAENYTGEDEIQVGTEFFYPEVEEALVGKKAKDSFETKIVLDDEWAIEDEDVGKELVLKVTINSASEEKIPELTEEFVKENMEYSSIDEYKAALKEELRKSKEEEYKAETVNTVLDYIVEHSKFNGYPQELYDSCKETFDAQNEYDAMLYGMEVEDFLEMAGLDEAGCKEAIEESVKYELAVAMISIDAQIDCTDEEVDAFLEDNYADYEYESVEELLTDYSKEELGYMVLYQKVMDYLYDNANKKTISEEEYLARNADMFGDEDEDAEFEEEGDIELDEGEDGELELQEEE